MIAPPYNPAQSMDAKTAIDDETLSQTLPRLAALSPAEYESVRKKESKKLGWRATVLDREVAALRPQNDQGDDLGISEPDPWPEEVDGNDLLDQITGAVQRHVVLSREAAEAVALWVAHTYAFEIWQHTPRLSITAPEKGCGKSLLLDVIACLVPRSLLTDSLSEAVAFRLAEEVKPVFLIDECDSHLASRNPDDGLRGILNSGHAKGHRAFRCVGDDNQVKGFDTFTPVAMAGIGNLPQTLADRSLQIRLEKKLASELVQPFRSDRTKHLHDLASQAARWAGDGRAKLADTDPEMGAWRCTRRVQPNVYINGID